MAFDPKKQREEVEKLNKEIKELYSQLGRASTPPIFKANEIDKATDAIIGLKSQLNSVNEELDYISRSFRAAVEDLSKQNTESNKLKASLRGISSIATQIKLENEDIANVDLKRINTLEKRAKLQFASLQISLKSDTISEEERKEGEKALEDKNNFLESVKQIRNEQEKINKDSGVKLFGGLEDISKAIPGLGKFTSAFSDASNASRIQAAENLKGIGKGSSALLAGFKSLGPAISKALGPLVILKELVSAFGQVNKESVELQKSMMLTSGEAMNFRSGLSTAAKDSENINITATKLLKTYSSLSDQFGFIAKFSNDTLVTTTKLTQVVGLQEEAANNLAAASVSTGGNFEDQYKSSLGVSYELQRQEGVQFNLKDILNESGKITGTIRANLGANPVQIAKAVTQARLFGSSLEQVATAGKSLLDFESSITAELEAELLLGRDINLEKARLAALNGDQVTLAKELRKEAGDFTEFSKMNVLQQEALAKSLGMQSNELSDILFKQDIQGKTAKELRALGKDELADRLEAQTVQDKFNASVEKLKELFADVATALMPVFEFLGMIFNLVGKIMAILKPISGIIGGAASGAAVGSVIPGVGTALGAVIGGIGGLISDGNKLTTVNDAIIPAGYGNTVIKKGKDTIALNNNDTVVAGTNLGGGESSVEAKRTNMLLEQILTKQGTIKLDSTDMGTAMSVNSYAIQ